MADVKHCTASPINDFEGFVHIFYCQIKNCTESLTEKLLRQVGWQGRVQNNQNSLHDVRSLDCRLPTRTYSPNFFSSRFWRAVVSFTAEIGFKIISNMILWKSLSCGDGHIRFLIHIKKKPNNSKQCTWSHPQLVVFRWSIKTDNQLVGILNQAFEPKIIFPINRTILLSLWFSGNLVT